VEVPKVEAEEGKWKRRELDEEGRNKASQLLLEPPFKQKPS
jgi:hypothetical protein